MRLIQGNTLLSLLGIVMLGMLLVFVGGCSSDEEKWRRLLEKSAMDARLAVDNLGKHLKSGTIPKAAILKKYAEIVKNQEPELADLVDTLGLDATVDGAAYKNLQLRLKEAEAVWPNAAKQGLSRVQSIADELQAIKTAAKVDIYGMMLTDPINVLADMSKGRLGRVESMSKEASLAANGATDFGTGSQLVGNPQYGNWRTNSSGGSFWEWYGKYALFSSLIRSVSYGAWAGGRNYSYYGEAGRNYYDSPRQRAQSKQTETRVRNKFRREGKRFQSPYVRSKAGSRVATMQSNSFRSARSSSRMASSRSSSFRTSRGSWGGK